MDSRIREIEQWLAKAKTGLIECGQEDYIKRLYLLDAEIRAVIKENGIQPGITSPKFQAGKVRRFNTPALVFGSVLAAFLLTATTAYLADPTIHGIARSQSAGPQASVVMSNASTEEPAEAAEFIPAASQGNVELSEAVLAEATLSDVPADSPVARQPAAPVPTAVALVSLPAASSDVPVEDSAKAPPLLPTPVHNPKTEEVKVIAAAKTSTEPVVPFEPNSRPAAASISSGAIDREIGRFTYFPEVPVYKEQAPEDQDAVNVLKSQLSGGKTGGLDVDSGDKQHPTGNGSVDNSKR